jgi:hypothetical protein
MTNGRKLLHTTRSWTSSSKESHGSARATLCTRLKEIATHKGPLKLGHPEWNGSLYNVKIIWWDGSSTWEPVRTIVKDDPVMLAAYVKKNNLQGMKGWWYPTIKAICEQEQSQWTSCMV